MREQKKPYTPDTVYASLILDQKDTSNDNQVGDKKFESRHQCCVRWIKQYVVDNVDKSGEEGTKMYSRQAVVDLVESWIGKNEADGSYKSLLIFTIVSQVHSRAGQKWRMDGRGALALGQHLPSR